jgi:hypothetical protein
MINKTALIKATLIYHHRRENNGKKGETLLGICCGVIY